MSHLLLGCTRSGRYPRWNYLDRLETNETLPRACAATMGLLGMLALAAFLSRSFWSPQERHDVAPTKSVSSSPWRSAPMPPPTIQIESAPVVVSITPPASGKLVPVEESRRTDEAPWTLDANARSAPGTNGPHTGEFAIDGEEEILLDSSTLPGPEDFVPLEREPELLFMLEPDYPELARDAGIEGTVLVRALVAPDGSVRQTILVRGVTGLNEAALRAVASAAFRPARQQGRPVAVWVVVPIEFRLRP